MNVPIRDLPVIMFFPSVALFKKRNFSGHLLDGGRSGPGTSGLGCSGPLGHRGLNVHFRVQSEHLQAPYIIVTFSHLIIP
jgi:hypothetical protein